MYWIALAASVLVMCAWPTLAILWPLDGYWRSIFVVVERAYGFELVDDVPGETFEHTGLIPTDRVLLTNSELRACPKVGLKLSGY